MVVILLAPCWWGWYARCLIRWRSRWCWRFRGCSAGAGVRRVGVHAGVVIFVVALHGVGVGGGVGMFVVFGIVLALAFNSWLFALVVARLLLYLMTLALGMMLVLALAIIHSLVYLLRACRC